MSGHIDGGAGAVGDVLIGPDSDTTWSLTGADAGTVGTTAFSDIESLIGGNAADTFAVLAAGSLSGLLDGGLDKATALGVPATDSLDYSTYGSTVSVDLALAIATAIASLSRIDAFRGSSLSGDTLTGPALPRTTSTGRSTARTRATSRGPSSAASRT